MVRQDAEFTQVIAVHGPDESGKDTVCRMLGELLDDYGKSWRKQGFADMMKLGIASVFGIPEDRAIQWCDQLKQPGATVMAAREDQILAQTSGRQFIRDYAETARRIHGASVWAHMLLPPEGAESKGFRDRWRTAGRMPDFAIISDLRFETEADAVEHYFGEIWGIYGRGNESSPSDLDMNRVKFWIDNGGTEDETLEQVHACLLTP